MKSRILLSVNMVHWVHCSSAYKSANLLQMCFYKILFCILKTLLFSSSTNFFVNFYGFLSKTHQVFHSNIANFFIFFLNFKITMNFIRISFSCALNNSLSVSKAFAHLLHCIFSFCFLLTFLIVHLSFYLSPKWLRHSEYAIWVKICNFYPIELLKLFWRMKANSSLRFTHPIFKWWIRSPFKSGSTTSMNVSIPFPDLVVLIFLILTRSNCVNFIVSSLPFYNSSLHVLVYPNRHEFSFFFFVYIYIYIYTTNQMYLAKKIISHSKGDIFN